MGKHVVLVPGFAGFDALGSLRYYSGVTELFQSSGRVRNNRLHYFDNFPTASVAQRAERLRKFLAKKWVRGEFQAGDEITLVGHSTGGLDIRQLLRDLRYGPGDPARPDPQSTAVDGCSTPVKASALRALIRRVVFMSVPHFGTNIADFFYKLRAPIQAAAASAAEGIRINKALPSFLSAFNANAVGTTQCELFDAIADTLRETDESSDILKRADEREARYNLLLWLDHVRRDVSALSDLRSYDPNASHAYVSPAFYGPTQRQEELDELAAPRPIVDDPNRNLPAIDVLSFATRVRNPDGNGLFAGVEHLTARAAATVLDYVGPPARLVSRIVPGTGLLRDLTTGALSLGALVRFGAQPARLFWHAYAICADDTLPFRRPPSLAVGGTCPLEPQRPPFSTATNLSERDNDGIVNTLSMLWPTDPRRQYTHYLINADHADIIGHYQGKPEPAPSNGGRHHAAYDIFQSGSGFGETHFEAVWREVFAFAL